MKIQRPNPGIMIILLGVISFLGTLFVFKFQEFFYDSHPYGFTLFGSVISLFLLLGLCAISARIILWAYSKVQVKHSGKVLASGFLISIFSVLLSMWMMFQQRQFLLTKIPDQFAEIPLSTGFINFLAVGLKPVLYTCAIITIVLLWIARLNKGKEWLAISSGKEKWQDIVLVISTMVVFAFFIRSVLRFIVATITIWTLG